MSGQSQAKNRDYGPKEGQIEIGIAIEIGLLFRRFIETDPDSDFKAIDC